jgi:alkanesulfonate monooxygenase SsuD/methylene tetrahydromethanopterin reductase-like flavin-dependent oxidoreductase (luciferase family)
MVGGGGEKRTLRLVARHADMCNLTVPDLDAVRHKIEVLHAHCATEGRDPADIRITHLSTADADSVDDHVGRYRQHAEAGVQTEIVNFPDLSTPEPLSRFAEVIASFRT